MFYFVRHGETDYSQKNTKIYQGFGVQLSGLTKKGIAQIRESAADGRLFNADIILCSPYTRAVQTAAILSKKLGTDIAIETDLHEWLANRNYIYENDETADAAYEEYIKNHGEYTSDAQMWEDMPSVKKRVIRVLKKYACYKKVIVSCHGMMIQAVTGSVHPKCGEIIEFELPDGL